MRKGRILFLACPLALIGLVAGAKAEIRYTITDLGSLAGSSFAYGLNNRGDVVGSYGPGSPFLYSHGSMIDLGSLGGILGSGSAINDEEEVVGYSSLRSGYYHAFFDFGNGMGDLGTFGGTVSLASGVNNEGLIVGYATTQDGRDVPFRYDGRTMTALPTLGGPNGGASAVNDVGHIVGAADVAQQLNGYPLAHAFYYDGTIHDLGTLGGLSSSASSINNTDQVVGTATKAPDGSVSHAFLYADGRMIDLGTLWGNV